jgi:hypothetical protein
MALSERFLRLLALGDVASNCRYSDRAARPVLNWRYGQRNSELLAVFGAPYRFKVLDAFPATQARQNVWLFMMTVWRNNYGDWSADGFLCSIAEQMFRAGIPTGDEAVRVFAYDGRY